MLKHLYTDNFGCLVNFEYPAAPLQLLLGSNGTGKSTVFLILGLLRKFVINGSPVQELFPLDSLTRWQERDVQSFELYVEGDGGLYHYRLEIIQERDQRFSRVAMEYLTLHEKMLFLFEEGKVSLYNDRFIKESEFFWDLSRSGLSNVVARPDNKSLTWFKEWMEAIYPLKISPEKMSSQSVAEVSWPQPDLSDFASWYRTLIQSKPGQLMNYFESLRQVIEGFDSLKFNRYGPKTMELRLLQRVEGMAHPVDFEFSELSDGQKLLVGLYAILHFALEAGQTICIDEPDNFIATGEIQPWLLSLRDAVEENGCQVLLISHNSEVLDYLAPDCGMQFSRPGGGPTRVRPYQSQSDLDLSPSELIARGADDE